MGSSVERSPAAKAEASATEAPISAGKHTPGPWAWGLDDVDAIWAVTTPPDGGNIICEPPSAGVASLARWPANARLIAAAPDLLEALTWALAEVEGRTRTEEDQREACLDRARAAIAKATGQ